MKPIAEALPLFQQPKRIAIITHYKPDGDAIGSTLALVHFLRLQGHQVSAITPNDAPEFLLFLPGTEWLINAEAEPKKASESLETAEIIFCLDFNDPARVQSMQPALEQAKGIKLLLDHHMFPKPVFDYGESNPAKSSTCEMVYDFINTSGCNSCINLDIAQCLYTGTLTDTGSFRFPVTTGAVHRMIADLKDRGLEHGPIHEAIYDSWSTNRMRFVGYALIERMEIFPQWQAGLISVTRADMKLFDLQPGDTEGLVQYPLSIRGIRFSTLITERIDEVRLSFRSKGDFDVNHFARTHFSGGGHFNASGGKSSESINDTILRFKKILSEFHPL
ncbi:MAG: DHH family phosphoesterase [Bacteroidetes bacterium]|nr:DHH family phosphoesterase [Bacteroidota bacterium]MBS1628940.1 DHH family phosphoesterase [Bacteroidota bacterium]